ncbi:hypothetical protein QJQ45_001541 [Haematococcus lacustris]|nr:hypothetical protein QJQ45_001541 [Haematococcus lacustris]
MRAVRDFRNYFMKGGEVGGMGTAAHAVVILLSSRRWLNDAAAEAKLVLFGAFEGLLAKTGLAPADIDILVTTCSIYCPTPSLASMLINHFKIPPGIQSYSLNGMGCANGVVAINLIRDLLQAHPNSNAVFLTTEVTTPAFYRGKDKSRLVTNVLFRMGASAMLFSNKRRWAGRAKYRLLHCIRTHTGARDTAYRCIAYGPDDEGHNGVSLGVNVVDEASHALTNAMTRVAPHILSWGQILAYLLNTGHKQLAKLAGLPRPPTFKPAFGQGVQHFLLHAGGAKVLEGLGASLQLAPHHLEPSRAVLHDYGNVSSSSTWYALGWIESVRGVARGDKVLQVGVGSGVKCGVNVWKAERSVHDLHAAWEHCLTPERRAALAARRGAGWHHVLRRLLFLLVLLALGAVMYSLARHAAGERAGAQQPAAQDRQELISAVAQFFRGSGPVPRSKSRFRLKARENKVINVPSGAVLRGCKKPRRKVMAHFQLRAERWLAPIKPHLQHLAAASSAGTSLVANLKHISVTLATWDAVWEVYKDPKWAQQRLRLYGAKDRALEQFFKKLEEDMAQVSMERHGHAKQLVVFFGAASIGTMGGWGADAVLRACCKVVCRPRGTDQRRGRVVVVDEHRTSRVSSAVNGKQPCESRLSKLVAPRKPPQAPRSSQEASRPAALELGPSTSLPAKRSKRTKAEPAAEPNKGKGKAAKAKPGRWLDRDCSAALNMQRMGESRWRPLELCWWSEQGALPAKGKEYPGLGYKRLRYKPPKAQEQPAEAQRRLYFEGDICTDADNVDICTDAYLDICTDAK